MITVIVLFLLFIFLGGSKDTILVADDGFEIRFTRILPFLSQSCFFRYSDTERIEADLPMTQKKGTFPIW